MLLGALGRWLTAAGRGEEAHELEESVSLRGAELGIIDVLDALAAAVRADADDGAARYLNYFDSCMGELDAHYFYAGLPLSATVCGGSA